VTPAGLGAIEARLASIEAEMSALKHAVPVQLVSPKEAAARLGVSLSTIRRRIANGELPVTRAGKTVRIDLAALRPASESVVADLAAAARWTR
jgi:excisionase family DNA binding protein